MDLASIGAAYTGLKFAKDTFQTVLGYKIEADTQTKIAESMAKLGATQDTLFELREELYRLQTENEKLRSDLKAHDDWDAQKTKYPLTETVGGAVVHESTFAPKHYACPACFARQIILVLQRQNDSSFVHCPACKVAYRVAGSRTLPVQRAERSGSAWDDDRY
jgi:regulator of replication initiation timing